MADEQLLSPQLDISSPSANASPLNPSTKRKRGGGNTAAASSRGVANLTPEQLARKRANDREAQRAIRERTKNQIDALNQRIRDLESQQPYHDLQVVLRQKDAVQAENEDIRRRLTSVMSIIQPLLGGQGALHELAVAAERNTISQTAPSVGQYQSPDDRNHQSPYPPAHLPPNSPHNEQAQADMGGGRSWSTPGNAPVSNMRGWQGESSQYDQSRNGIQPDLPSYTHNNDERLGVEFLIDRGKGNDGQSHSTPAGTTTATLTFLTPASMYNNEPQTHLLLPRNVSPTCPLDGVMLDFLAEARAKVAEGTPVAEVVGPPHPNLSALMDPNRNADAHPLSRLFVDILRTFPLISSLPEQVATVYNMFIIMRWQIEPTQENYDRIPEWLQPRPSQLFTPHGAWIDPAPWPKLRERLTCMNPPQAFDDFFIPFTKGMRVNWPHAHADILILANSSGSDGGNASSGSSPNDASGDGKAQSPAGGENWIISPAFEKHIRDLSNWSQTQEFAATMPHLADCVPIR